MKQRNGISPFVAGLAGVVAGATAVSALALSDEEVRKKALKKAKKIKGELQKWSTEKLNALDHHEELQEKMDNENVEISETISHTEEKINN